MKEYEGSPSHVICWPWGFGSGCPEKESPPLLHLPCRSDTARRGSREMPFSAIFPCCGSALYWVAFLCVNPNPTHSPGPTISHFILKNFSKHSIDPTLLKCVPPCDADVQVGRIHICFRMREHPRELKGDLEILAFMSHSIFPSVHHQLPSTVVGTGVPKMTQLLRLRKSWSALWDRQVFEQVQHWQNRLWQSLDTGEAVEGGFQHFLIS